MALKRMDNVAIVVADLDAAVAFFTELGMELEGEATVEGEDAGRLVGLERLRSRIAMMRAPAGYPGRAAAAGAEHARPASPCSPSTTSTTASPACERAAPN